VFDLEPPTSVKEARQLEAGTLIKADFTLIAEDNTRTSSTAWMELSDDAKTIRVLDVDSIPTRKA
jgi:hypothetical protein